MGTGPFTEVRTFQNQTTSDIVKKVLGEAGLTDDLFKVGIGGRLLFWVAVAFSSFQLVTGFGIPLDKDFVPGIDLAGLAGAALILGAIKVGWDGLKGRNVLEGVLALITLAATYGILVRYAGGLPSQVLRTMHVGFLCLVAALALSASLGAKGGRTAEEIRSLGTSLGMAADRVGESIAENAEDSPAATYRNHSGGRSIRAPATNRSAVTTSPASEAGTPPRVLSSTSAVCGVR